MQATFTAMGESADVLALPDQLAGELLHRTASGTGTEEPDVVTKFNYVIVKLPLSPENEEKALADVERWLQAHESVLRACEARKVIEFETYLERNVGCQFLSLENLLLRLCCQLGLDISVQSIQMLSPGSPESPCDN